MLTYSFVDIGSDSLYEHLYKCIKNDIIKGVLKVGDKLPSKRNFAKNLNISTITVENAYAQLMSEGYIYSIPKKGFFVCDIAKNLIDNEATIKTNYKSDDKGFINDSRYYFADFLSNRTSKDNFPFSIWAKLMREVISEKNDELLVSSPGGGILELREAIADYLWQFRGMKVSPNQIIVGAGTEYLYGLLIQLFGRDKIFAVEDPGYKKISQIYKSNGIKCEFVPLDDEGISVKELEDREADIIHISPSHHYPTGKVMPISRRYEILGWASKSDSRYIIEDDYDCEFRLLGKPIPSMESIDVMEKVIYMNTFTKSLASTIRISYMVLPKNLLETFYSKLGFYSCTVSNFEQYTLARFIKEGYFEKHINRMRNFYRNKRDYMVENINKYSDIASVKIKEEDAGLHFLLEVDTDMTDDELIESARDNDIRISCLSKYYYNNENAKKHIIVINYSGIENDKIEEAVKRLLKSIKRNK